MAGVAVVERASVVQYHACLAYAQRVRYLFVCLCALSYAVPPPGLGRSPCRGQLGRVPGPMAKAATRPPRPRFEGTSQDLGDVIMEFADDRSIICYDEAERVEGAKIDKKAIEAATPVLVKLQAVMPTLAFKRSTMAGALLYVAKVKKYEFRDEEEKRDWHTTMTRRFMNVCRATSQSMNTDWGRRLFPWLNGVAASTSPAVAACARESGQDPSEAKESDNDFILGGPKNLGRRGVRLVGPNSARPACASKRQTGPATQTNQLQCGLAASLEPCPI